MKYRFQTKQFASFTRFIIKCRSGELFVELFDIQCVPNPNLQIFFSGLTGKNALEKFGVPEQERKPQVMQHTKEALQFHGASKKLRLKLDRANRRNGSLKILAKECSISLVQDMSVSETSKSILEMEMKNFKKKPKGRRWSDKDNEFLCQSIFKRSPKAIGC